MDKNLLNLTLNLLQAPTRKEQNIAYFKLKDWIKYNYNIEVKDKRV